MTGENNHTRPSFIVDNMLRGLARWLRFLGFPSEIVMSVPEAEKIRDLHPEAIFLTSSYNHLADFAGGKSHAVESGTIKEQLHELESAFGIFGRIDLLSICSVCNVPIEPATKSQVKDRVPEKVWRSFDKFWQCPHCHRIYWKGGHVERLIEKLKRMDIPL
ncbi:MAG: Mut7-C RNAse domain-containing protein [Calditrichia bacterium]